MPGQLGNAAIAGHRTTYGQPFFRSRQAPHPGDEIMVTTRRTAATCTRSRARRSCRRPTTRWSPRLDPTIATLTLTTCHPSSTARASGSSSTQPTRCGRPDRSGRRRSPQLRPPDRRAGEPAAHRRRRLGADHPVPTDPTTLVRARPRWAPTTTRNGRPGRAPRGQPAASPTPSPTAGSATRRDIQIVLWGSAGAGRIGSDRQQTAKRGGLGRPHRRDRAVRPRVVLLLPERQPATPSEPLRRFRTRRAQRPVKFGGRLSRNVVRPSSASALAQAADRAASNRSSTARFGHRPFQADLVAGDRRGAQPRRAGAPR